MGHTDLTTITDSRGVQHTYDLTPSVKGISKNLTSSTYGLGDPASTAVPSIYSDSTNNIISDTQSYLDKFYNPNFDQLPTLGGGGIGDTSTPEYSFFKGNGYTDKQGNFHQGSFANSDAMAAGKLGLGAVTDIYNGVMGYKNYKQQVKMNDANIKSMNQNYGLALATSQNSVADHNARQQAAQNAGMAITGKKFDHVATATA